MFDRIVVGDVVRVILHNDYSPHVDGTNGTGYGYGVVVEEVRDRVWYVRFADPFLAAGEHGADSILSIYRPGCNTCLLHANHHVGEVIDR